MPQDTDRQDQNQDKDSKKAYEKPQFEKHAPLESVGMDYYYYRGSERVYWYSD